MLPRLTEPHIKCDLNAAQDVPIFDCGPPADVAKRLGVTNEKLARFVRDAEERGYLAVRVGLHLIAADGKDIVEAMDGSLQTLIERVSDVPVPPRPMDHPLLRPISPEVQKMFDDIREEQRQEAAKMFWMNGTDDDRADLQNLATTFVRAKEDEDKEELDAVLGALNEIVEDKPLGQLKGLIRKNEWTEADQRASHREGWDIFQRSDNGKLELNRLDDPEGVWIDEGNEGEYDGPQHENDHHAATYVQKKADEGDARCRKAIEILIDGGSPDVKKFGLNDAAWTKRDEKGWIEVQLDYPPAGVDEPVLIAAHAVEPLPEARSAETTPEEFNAAVDEAIATTGTFTMDGPDGKKLVIESDRDGSGSKYVGWIGHNEAGMETLDDTPYDVYSQLLDQAKSELES